MYRKCLRVMLLATMIIMSMTFLFSGCTGGGSLQLIPTRPPLSSDEIEGLGALTEFEYNYGSYNGGAYEYTIKNINENNNGNEDTEPIYRFIAKGSNGVDMYANADVEPKVLDDLKSIIASRNIFAWDGFDKHDKNILDGHGFGLTVAFANGSIHASGYEKYPKDYSQGHAALAGYLSALADSFAEQEIGELDIVNCARVNFRDEAGKYEMHINRPDAEDIRYEEFVHFLTEQYHRFQNEAKYADGDYCEVKLEVLPHGRLPIRYCDVVIRKALYPDVYAEILEKALTIDGKPLDYFSSEEFQTVMYKKKFIYPIAFLYDQGGLGTVIVDMPEQTITWNDKVYTASQEDMLEFYKYVDKIPPYGTDIRKHELPVGYKEDTTVQEVFEASIASGYTWILGRNHNITFFLYGDKGEKLSGWDDVVAEFENLIKKASKE